MMNRLLVTLSILIAQLLPVPTFGADCAPGVDHCQYNGGTTAFENNTSILLNEHHYEIVPASSTLSFRVDSPIGEVWASFQDFNGDFALIEHGIHSDPAVVDVNTQSLDTEAAFIAMLLRSNSFFDVDNFPSIRFIGSSFEWFNKNQAVLKGFMTIQNITQPVAFYVDLVSTSNKYKYADRITLKASTTIRRSAFGLSNLLPLVSDNVNLYLSVDAFKKNASVI